MGIVGLLIGLCAVVALPAGVVLLATSKRLLGKKLLGAGVIGLVMGLALGMADQLSAMDLTGFSITLCAVVALTTALVLSFTAKRPFGKKVVACRHLWPR